MRVSEDVNTMVDIDNNTQHTKHARTHKAKYTHCLYTLNNALYAHVDTKPVSLSLCLFTLSVNSFVFWISSRRASADG